MPRLTTERISIRTLSLSLSAFLHAERKVAFHFHSRPRYLRLAFFRSLDRPRVYRRVDDVASTSIVSTYRHRSLPASSCRRSIAIRHPVPSFSYPFDVPEKKWRVSKSKRAHGGQEDGAGEKRGDLRNYGRWKTSDLPGDRHRRAPGIRYRVTRVTGA